jgi:hypothetical protein
MKWANNKCKEFPRETEGYSELEIALACYNWGAGNVLKKIKAGSKKLYPNCSRKYVNDIINRIGYWEEKINGK